MSGARDRSGDGVGTGPLSVFGSFGYGNLGDELVPRCLAHLLAEAGVWSGEPVAISRYGEVIAGDVLPSGSEARAALCDASGRGRMVLVGGGIIEPRAGSSLNRAFDLARDLPGLDLRALAVSVEPGVRFSWLQKRRLARQARRLGPIGVRDVLSARVLQGLIPGHAIEVLGDIALWSQPAPLPPDIEAAVGPGGIAVILHNTWLDAEGFHDWLADELADLSQASGLSVVLLPFAIRRDRRDMRTHQRLGEALAARGVKAAFPAEACPAEMFTPEVAAEILRRSRLCVSMRLHGCVMAYAQRTPFVGLAYHPKLAGFAETVGHGRFLLPRDLPGHQTPGHYGYGFGDLDFGRGELCRTGLAAMAEAEFSGLDFWRARQVDFVRAVFEVTGTEGPPPRG